jgi:hypothetical protein
VASAGGISGFECNRISRRGRRNDLHRRDERLGSIGFTSKLILEALSDNAPVGHGRKPGECPTLHGIWAFESPPKSRPPVKRSDRPRCVFLFRHGSENEPGQPVSNKWSKYWHDGVFQSEPPLSEMGSNACAGRGPKSLLEHDTQGARDICNAL